MSDGTPNANTLKPAIEDMRIPVGAQTFSDDSDG